ncbi:hypothetical protein IAT38_006646 [Cryptococcus sp. DSM 104549]
MAFPFTTYGPPLTVPSYPGFRYNPPPPSIYGRAEAFAYFSAPRQPPRDPQVPVESSEPPAQVDRDWLPGWAEPYRLHNPSPSPAFTALFGPSAKLPQPVVNPHPTHRASPAAPSRKEEGITALDHLYPVQDLLFDLLPQLAPAKYLLLSRYHHQKLLAYLYRRPTIRDDRFWLLLVKAGTSGGEIATGLGYIEELTVGALPGKSVMQYLVGWYGKSTFGIDSHLARKGMPRLQKVILRTSLFRPSPGSSTHIVSMRPILSFFTANLAEAIIIDDLPPVPVGERRGRDMVYTEYRGQTCVRPRILTLVQTDLGQALLEPEAGGWWQPKEIVRYVYPMPTDTKEKCLQLARVIAEYVYREIIYREVTSDGSHGVADEWRPWPTFCVVEPDKVADMVDRQVESMIAHLDFDWDWEEFCEIVGMDGGQVAEWNRIIEDK